MFNFLQAFKLQKLHANLENIKLLKVFTEYDLAVVQSQIALSRGKISKEMFIELEEYSSYLNTKILEIIEQEKKILGLIQVTDKKDMMVR